MKKRSKLYNPRTQASAKAMPLEQKRLRVRTGDMAQTATPKVERETRFTVSESASPLRFSISVSDSKSCDHCHSFSYGSRIVAMCSDRVWAERIAALLEAEAVGAAVSMMGEQDRINGDFDELAKSFQQKKTRR